MQKSIKSIVFLSSLLATSAVFSAEDVELSNKEKLQQAADTILEVAVDEAGKLADQAHEYVESGQAEKDLNKIITKVDEDVIQPAQEYLENKAQGDVEKVGKKAEKEVKRGLRKLGIKDKKKHKKK